MEHITRVLRQSGQLPDNGSLEMMSDFSIPFIATGEESAAYNHGFLPSTPPRRGRQSVLGLEEEGMEAVFGFTSSESERMAHLVRVLQNAGRIRSLPYVYTRSSNSPITSRDDGSTGSSDNFSTPFIATGDEVVCYTEDTVSM
ncbi:uncharacterized protein [Diadema setosum]|uniref:uncharacterized protein n=1 Tax=Diadema setosum TaxID=31175 RepID=UPI003B3B68B4